MIDPISDMLTRIRNAQRALLPTVEVPHSKMKESIAHILKKEGYVGDVAVEATGKVTKTIKIKRQQGMDITIVTSAPTDAEALELLKLMGMPFAEGR